MKGQTVGAVSKARKSNQYAVIANPHTPFGTGSAKQSLTQNTLIVRDCFSRTSFAMTALIVAGILLRQSLQQQCVALPRKLLYQKTIKEIIQITVQTINS